MDASMTIEEFNALLNADTENSALLAALTQLKTVENPEDMTSEIVGPTAYWYGWT